MSVGIYTPQPMLAIRGQLVLRQGLSLFTPPFESLQKTSVSAYLLTLGILGLKKPTTVSVFFTWGVETGTQLKRLRVVQEAFYPLSHLPAPCIQDFEWTYTFSFLQYMQGSKLLDHNVTACLSFWNPTFQDRCTILQCHQQCRECQFLSNSDSICYCLCKLQPFWM